MNSIKIKEEYFKKPLQIIKNDLNYLSTFLQHNLMTLDLEVVIYYEELVKILSQVLLEKMKAEVFPKNDEEKFVLIDFSDRDGKLSSKLKRLLPYSTHKKMVSFEELKDKLGDYTFAYLDSCSIRILRKLCSELGIKHYQDGKQIVITKLLDYSVRYTGRTRPMDSYHQKREENRENEGVDEK